MFSTYNRNGISLAYPENWRLEEEPNDEASVQLTISSPATAFWTLILYPGPQDLEGLASQALEALRGEYPDLESTDARQRIGEEDLIGYDVDFIYLDLANSVRIRVGHHGASTLLIFAQYEGREAATAEPVFDAIATSLLSDTTPGDEE